jgi:UDP-GlcNAc:undecaprenyl-phosphate GlcNAc-1-phosphate transferase
MLVPVARWLSFKLGRVAQPRPDRWHQKPTPLLGGVGMFFAFAVTLLLIYTVLSPNTPLRWPLLVGSALMFFVGIYDDLKPLTPPVKMAGQLLAAGIVVFSGYRTSFFSSELLNILFTVLWLVGITNAINLLDNMDGLAGGISFITACLLSFFFWRVPGQEEFFLLSLTLAGAILGFLIFNFPPASIFMGDSGSLFLGFTLAALAIARKPQASNVFAVMSVPTLIFLLPILDTTFVTFTRLLRGQSPAQGGRDHTSHRLVAFGLSERRAVLVLYGLALGAGIAGAVIESLDYTLSLILIPVIVLSAALLAAYLGRLKVVGAPRAGDPIRRTGPLTTIMVELTYKRRMLELALDFFIISVAYYLAFLTHAGFALDAAATDLLILSFPAALGAGYLANYLFRVYQGVWEYIGISDLIRFAGAALVSAVICGVALWGYAPDALFPGALFLFGIFMFMGLTASRSSFKVLDQVLGRARRPPVQNEIPVLLYGAGDFGELALRWILQNNKLGYHVVGIVDSDPYKWGRKIHGVEVLGSPEKLETLLQERGIQGVIVCDGENIQPSLALCRKQGVWVQRMRFEFEEVEV